MSESNTVIVGPEIIDGLELTGGQPGFICYPWNVTPVEYLDFAKADLKDTPPRSYINAIGNAKRAIHAHIDFLLHNCGRCRRDTSLPEKLSLLNTIGIIAPEILNKYNRLRNLVEHEYDSPTEAQALELIDVANLFLEATRCYTRALPSSLIFQAKDRSQACTIDCRWDEKEITIVASGKHPDKCGAWRIQADKSPELWLKWVSRILRLIQDLENPYVRCR